MAVSTTDAQVNVYARDPDGLARFYTGLGMSERFRFPEHGTAEHVEVGIGGMTLGLTSAAALERLTSLSADPGRPSAEVVLWCSDVDALHAAAQALGARSVAAPRVFHGRLRAAWVEDPEGNRVKIVALVASSEGGSGEA